MDMLVPLMLIGSLLTVCLLVLAGAWILFSKVSTRGLSSLIPRIDLTAWNRFWFTPADPTVLGLIRLTCGAITTYTLFAYTFMLQEFVGKDAWYDLPMRQEYLRARPNGVGPLAFPFGYEYAPAVPSTPEEKAYCEKYKAKWGVLPPLPFPHESESTDLDIFKARFGYDLRFYGLHPPQTEEEALYIPEYMDHPANIMRSASSRLSRPTAKEKQEIFDYMARPEHEGVDPRLAYSLGQPSWSMWFHVTDPLAMNVIHGLIVVVAFLFTIGLCTRLTSVLTWMASLWYIHRNPVLLFGVDTMMVILLLYLMIGPSGAALSVDRLIARWWSRAKPGVINRWRALWGRPALAEGAVQPAAYSPTPTPTVSANLAIRMLQVHLCIIYLVSGLSKLQGSAWWSGTAVWGTLANFEFAPMAFEIGGVQIYNEFLRALGRHQVLLDGFLTSACVFTLVFELGYAFLIWRPNTRWVFLAGAIILHGFIGILMGLKTFSLMMLVMNVGFLRREEVVKVLSVITWPILHLGAASRRAVPRTCARRLPSKAAVGSGQVSVASAWNNDQGRMRPRAALPGRAVGKTLKTSVKYFRPRPWRHGGPRRSVFPQWISTCSVVTWSSLAWSWERSTWLPSPRRAARRQARRKSPSRFTSRKMTPL